MNIVHIILRGDVNIVNIFWQALAVKTGSYHHGALHEAILDAAVIEASRSGPQAIGVRALAKAVGVSPSAIYRHVPSIDTLLTEVSQVARQHLAARMIERREEAPSSGTALDRASARLRAVGRAYVHFALSDPHLFDTAFTPTSLSPAKPDDPSAWQVVVDGVDELVEAGGLNPTAASNAVLVAWSSVHGIASILRRGLLMNPVADDHAIEVADDYAIEVVLDGVRRSIATL
uniref:Transcriptional regulator, TetR family n=1 Tax=Mycolicibacterium gilvum (strain PYR-GCK) TaxID=350054 RepID=A4TGL0_MYCGI